MTKLSRHLRKFHCCTYPPTPQPVEPFIVEVDASDAEVGAFLSQRTGEKSKLHPIFLFSKKLSPTEQNYDVGNRELLAIELALEKWRHWLEGAKHPFHVYADHKNLEYLKTPDRQDGHCCSPVLALLYLIVQVQITKKLNMPGMCNLRCRDSSVLENSCHYPYKTVLHHT